MSGEQLVSALSGLVCLAVGLHAIVSRRVGISDENSAEPHLWLYGWRAVAVGCLGIALSLLLFACAAGYINLPELRLSGHDLAGTDVAEASARGMSCCVS
jgi:hypothetical protein